MNNNQFITNYYINHRDELLGFVSSRISDSEEAEDIVQNVFLRLLLSYQLITEKTLPALVYAVMRSLISDYFRRHTHFERYEHYIKNTCSEETSMESVFSAKEIMERLERGIARLPENSREIYRLHIYGGLKVSEISKQMGEDYKRVEHCLGKARHAMRDYLRQYA